jgi:hypothetical protein
MVWPGGVTAPFVMRLEADAMTLICDIEPAEFAVDLGNE